MRWIAALLVIGALTACGGRQSTSSEAEDAPVVLVLLGEQEQQAVGYLQDMTFVLESNVDTPEQGMERMEALLRVNADAMIANARALDARYAALSPEEQELYTREWVLYVEPYFAQWRNALREFRRYSGDVGLRMERLIENFDTRYEADEAAERAE